ncbi:MAG: hypothetical protein AAF333_07800 [Planctomycetota bacterium]
METPPKTPHSEPELEDSGEFSNFFNDVAAFWDRFGTPLVGILAVAALIFAGYNLITQRAIAAKQNAWIDLYGSASVDSLQLVVDTTKSPVVNTVANLRAGDLLIAESRAADGDKVQAILDNAAGHYQAALDGAPHTLYKLNALDGLAVVAESRFETDKAREYYEQIRMLAGDQFPYWVSVAERRLTLLPDLAEPVVFAPEPEAELDSEAASDLGAADAEAVLDALTAPADPSSEEPAVE